MIKNKWIGLLSILLMAASVLFVGIGYFAPSIFEPYTGTAEPLYVAAMDKEKVLQIQIIADEKEWADMLENATAEEYISATVVIDGTEIKNVGIRPKGNSSLSMVAQDDTTDRYSFKIEFDHYITGQTWLGLDKLVVNNMQGDASYMKEYLSYDLMAYTGVASPLYAFSDISVNGETWGCYLAVEVLEDSYASRIYGSDHGKLYKPESMGMRGNGQMNDFLERMQDDTSETSQQQENEEGGQPPTQDQTQSSAEGGFGAAPGGATDSTLPQQGDTAERQRPTGDRGQFQAGDASNAISKGGIGGFGGGSGGSTLEYTDDEIASYSSIFDNAVFKSTDRDYNRVIDALEKLSAGEDLDSVVDVTATLKYFAAQTVVVNLDSYVSSMSHNYYLYEKDGQLTMLPWDYNLAFGGFQSGSTSSVVNFPIDTPVSGVSLEDRPILGKLLEVPEYLELYHNYLNEIVEGYFNSGLFAETIDSLDALISPYVEADPTAFYDFTAYQNGVAELKKLGILRAQSIEGQLDGSIPSTTEGQSSNPDALVDSSSINLSALGSMGGGFGGGGGMAAGDAAENSENTINPNGMMPNFNRENMQKAMEIIETAGDAELTAEQIEQLEELGFTEEQLTIFQSMGQGGFFGGGEQPGNVEEGAAAGERPNNMQGGANNWPQRENTGSDASSSPAASGLDAKTWIVLGISTVLLLGGMFLVIFYKRRRSM